VIDGLSERWIMRFGLAVAVAVAVVAAIPAGAQSPRTAAPCGFSLSGTAGTPRVTGPDDLVAWLTVVPQPDSPVDIIAVDLTKMAVSIEGSSYREDRGSEYSVSLRNRSDQPVSQVDGMVLFRVVGQRGDGAGGTGWSWKGTLMPGETVRTVSRSGGGSGRNAEGDVTLSTTVDRVVFKDCVYEPSKSYWSPAAPR
jgi:hypothetical protein